MMVLGVFIIFGMLNEVYSFILNVNIFKLVFFLKDILLVLEFYYWVSWLLRVYCILVFMGVITRLFRWVFVDFVVLVYCY